MSKKLWLDKKPETNKDWLVILCSCILFYLVLGALGMTNLWAAVFADVGVSVIAICNAIRALRPPKE